ncbi:MAG: DUF748 domain-containing protein [Magnetococcales bacterium]|nr:DUF748 domain-containing protein [Magnetococcales bacterium]
MEYLLDEKPKSGFGKFLVYLIVFIALSIAGVLYTATTWMVWGLEKGLPGLEVRLQEGKIKPLEGRVELIGLEFLQKDEPVLQMSKLAVDISLRSLIKQQIIVDRILLHKGGIWLKELEGGNWQVAGVELPKSQEEASNNNSTPTSPEAEAPFIIDELGVGFRGILLSQLTFNIQELKRYNTIVLRRLQLSSPGLLHSASQIGLALDVALDRGSLALYGQATPFTPVVEFNGHLDIDKFSLAIPKQFVATIPPSLQGSFSSNLDLDIAYSKTQTTNLKANGTLELAGFQITQDNIALQLPLTIFRGGLYAALPQASSPTGTVEGELTTQNGSFNMTGEKPVGVTLTDFSFKGSVNPKGGNGSILLTGVNGSAALTPDKNSLLAFNRLLLDELKFGVDKNVAVKEVKLGQLNVQVTGNNKPILALEEIDLQQLQYSSQGRLTLQAINVTDSSVYIHRSLAGKWPWTLEEKKTAVADNNEKLDQTLPGDTQAKEESLTQDPPDNAESKEQTVKSDLDNQGETSDQEDQAAKSALAYSLGSLTLPKGLTFTLFDEGVKPAVLVNGRIDTLEIGPIDSEAPGDETAFKIIGGVGEYGKFDFAGSAKPLNETPDLVVKGAINAFDLPPYSSYVVPELGYLIKSGTLDISTDTKVADNKIDGKNKLNLKMFNLVSAKSLKSKEISKKLPMPMDAALNLLRSNNGDIKMAIPVSGTIDKPNVDFSEAINKVVGGVSVKAAKTTAIVALGPVGLALAAVDMVGSAAIDSAQQSNLKPVNFKAGSSFLNQDEKKVLDEIATFLAKQKKKRITACGIVVPKDQLVLTSKIGKESKDDSSPETTNNQPSQQVDVTKSRVLEKFYTVRVASFKKIARANKSRDIWQKRGHKVLIRELKGKSGITWHAVSIGVLPTSKEAKKLSRTIKTIYKTDSFVAKVKGAEAKKLGMLAAVSSTNVISDNSKPEDILITQKLNSLAKERAAVVKNYLVTKGKVSMDRIFSCLPVPPNVDDKKGPRVTFSF